MELTIYNSSMSRSYVVALILSLFALFSILILKSIAPSLVAQQLIFFLVGFILFFLISKFNFSWILKLSWTFYILVILSLALTLVIGNVTKGSTRWIDVGFFNVQPSQITIPIVTLFLANFISQKDMNKIKNLLIFWFYNLIPAILILIEPDLGTTIIYLVVTHSVLFFSNISFINILKILLIASISAFFAYSFVLKDYQKERITSFIDSQNNLTDAGYNAYQSMISVGSGQFLGRGLGQGVQSHLSFLPERQTDFIFASLSEELGFVGSVFIILLYLFLFSLIWFHIKESQNRKLILYGQGILVMIVFQVVVNIGMNIGLMPITGITLPLVSYGGSSILSILISIGVIFSDNNYLSSQKINLLN